jgi:antitoxin ParD1/3/4
MPRLTIDVSDEHAEFIEEEIATGRANSRADAIATIIGEARRYQALEEIGQLAREGIESGEPIPITPEYWEKKKQLIRKVQRARTKRLAASSFARERTGNSTR